MELTREEKLSGAQMFSNEALIHLVPRGKRPGVTPRWHCQLWGWLLVLFLYFLERSMSQVVIFSVAGQDRGVSLRTFAGSNLVQCYIMSPQLVRHELCAHLGIVP